MTNQKTVTLCFRVHQPRRLQHLREIRIGSTTPLFQDDLTVAEIEKAARLCYLPVNSLLLSLLEKHANLRVSFILPGGTLELLQQHSPDTIESFRHLAATRAVDFLGETYFSSLASVDDHEEFEVQILQQAEKLVELFRYRPTVFANTGLLYNDAIGKRLSSLGFHGVLTEGADRLDQDIHQLYHHHREPGLKILLRDHRVSDAIAFFKSGSGEQPSASELVSRIENTPGSMINVALEYSTFGYHHPSETGIIAYLEALLTQLCESPKIHLKTATESAHAALPSSPLSVKETVSWSIEKDLSLWLGSTRQKEAHLALINLSGPLRQPGKEYTLNQWRWLQEADHLAWMSDQADTPGTLQALLTPYGSAHEAYLNFMHVIAYFQQEIALDSPEHTDNNLAAIEQERRINLNKTPVWARNIEGTSVQESDLR